MHYNNQIQPTVEAEAAGSIWELEGEEDEQKINIPQTAPPLPELLGDLMQSQERTWAGGQL